MSNYLELRKKYPRWAHRRDARKKRRRKSRRRRKRRKQVQSQGSTTEGMLLSLLQQLMVGNRLPATKHGENVVTGYAGGVSPDALAPVRSRMEARLMRGGDRNGGGAAGAAAVGAVGAAPAAGT